MATSTNTPKTIVVFDTPFSAEITFTLLAAAVAPLIHFTIFCQSVTSVSQNLIHFGLTHYTFYLHTTYRNNAYNE